MNSKKIGNDWEKECLSILGENGFFATKLKERDMGAPFDIIATKDNIFYAIEAKEILKGTRFSMTRIEFNQKFSYKKLMQVNSKNYFFFFKTEIGKFILHANNVILCKDKSIDVKNGEKLEDWVEKM